MAERKLTGTIEIAAPDRRSAAASFVDGRPVKARTSEPVAYLGRVLLERGVLTEEQLNRSLAELAKEKAKGKRLHGDLLLALGLVDRAKLQAAMRDQLARKLRYIAKLPPDTGYAYYERFDALAGWGGGELVALDPLPLVWSILRSDPPEDHMTATLARVEGNALRIARGAELDRLGLDEQERIAIDLLRTKPLRVAELASAAVLTESAARAFAYALLATKQVELVRASGAPVTSTAPPSPEPPPSSARGSDALRRAMKVATKPKAFPVPAGRIGTVPPPPATLSTDNAARWAEIADRAQTIERADYFMMLDVARDATQEEIEASFFALAKRWHPDRLPAEFGPVRDACSRVFARMSEAHATLGDPEKRARYMKLLADGSGTPEAQETVARVVEAATTFQKAEIAFKRNDFTQAEALCRKAVEVDPTQADYLAMLAWLESLKPENQSREKTADCIKALDKAISLNERCEKALFWRGMLHKRNGNERSAVRDFQRVTEINPRNIDAAREVRLYEMRSTGKTAKSGVPGPDKRSTPVPNSQKSGGFLGKLFKKGS